MRSFLPALLLTMPLAAADFPSPSELPSVPGLPDPLVSRAGGSIKTRDEWNEVRKPELRRLFEHYMYGKEPRRIAPAKTALLTEDKAAFGGAATLREFSVDLGLPSPVHLLVVTPNAKPQKAACFLGLNFHGNHQVLDHPGIALPQSWVRANGDGSGGKTARAEDRGKEREVWNVEQTIQRGYAFATFFQSDVIPDDRELAEPLLRKVGEVAGTERGPADTATIMAWAWGFSRMLDVLEQLPEIDAKRVATVGHSRNGKTALLAAAFDDRFAMALPCQAGCGGTAPSRVEPELAKLNEKGRPTVETVAVINKAFPHWFCDNFKAFNDEPARLPFDQHELIALCAPRPVMCTCATEDVWANPDGQFAMLKAAEPVYRLFENDALGQETKPEVGKPLLSRLGYFIRPGKHSMTKLEWDVWLDYADRWLR